MVIGAFSLSRWWHFVIANAVLRVVLSCLQGARVKMVAISFYTGEALKILITIVLFSVAYMYMQLELVPLKLTYLLALGINICAPVLFINNKKLDELWLRQVKNSHLPVISLTTLLTFQPTKWG